MTIPQIDFAVSTLVTPYLNSLRGQLAAIGATDGVVSPDDFHSLLSWPGPEGQFTMVYNERAALLFMEEEFRGVVAFDHSLLSDENRAEKFKKEIHQAVAEGAL